MSKARLLSMGEGFLGCLGGGDFATRRALARVALPHAHLEVARVAAGWAHCAAVTRCGAFEPECKERTCFAVISLLWRPALYRTWIHPLLLSVAAPPSFTSSLANSTHTSVCRPPLRLGAAVRLRERAAAQPAPRDDAAPLVRRQLDHDADERRPPRPRRWRRQGRRQWRRRGELGALPRRDRAAATRGAPPNESRSKRGVAQKDWLPSPLRVTPSARPAAAARGGARWGEVGVVRDEGGQRAAVCRITSAPPFPFTPFTTTMGRGTVTRAAPRVRES